MEPYIAKQYSEAASIEKVAEIAPKLASAAVKGATAYRKTRLGYIGGLRKMAEDKLAAKKQIQSQERSMWEKEAPTEAEARAGQEAGMMRYDQPEQPNTQLKSWKSGPSLSRVQQQRQSY